MAGVVVDISSPTYKFLFCHHHVDSSPAQFDRGIATIHSMNTNEAALITADTPIL